jgi:hypothetical protein
MKNPNAPGCAAGGGLDNDGPRDDEGPRQPMARKGFEARIRELVTGQATLERIAEAMLSAQAALKVEYEKLHKAVLAIVREDAVCRRLMTVPSVGPHVDSCIMLHGACALWTHMVRS